MTCPLISQIKKEPPTQEAFSCAVLGIVPNNPANSDAAANQNKSPP